MRLEEQIRRHEYVIDADAVAEAILRRITAASRPARRSEKVVVAAKPGLRPGQHEA